MSPASYRAAPPRVGMRNSNRTSTTSANRFERPTGAGPVGRQSGANRPPIGRPIGRFPREPLRRQLLLERLAEPCRSLGDLRGAQLHRLRAPLLALRQVAA